MNNYMNAWISIAKRKALFSLDSEESKFNDHLLGQCINHRMVPLDGNTSHSRNKNSSKKWLDEKASKSILKELPSHSIIDPESSDPKGMTLPKVQSRMRAVKEIIAEICLIDRINVKKYRLLDDRQRSLLNKILSYKYQAEFLDVIDTGGISTVDTEEYLRDDHKQGHEKTIMYLRLRMLLETKPSKLRQDHCLNENTEFFNNLAVRYFGELGQGLTSVPGENTFALFQEVTTIRHLAVVALQNQDSIKWITGMKAFLYDLTQVSQEKIISEYEKTIETRLTNFFHDEDHDVNTFFAKLKVKMKEGKATLPMTSFEIKHWDDFIVQLLKSEIIQLDTYLLNTASSNDSSVYPMNCTDHPTDPLKSCQESEPEKAQQLAEPQRLLDGQGEG